MDRLVGTILYCQDGTIISRLSPPRIRSERPTSPPKSLQDSGGPKRILQKRLPSLRQIQSDPIASAIKWWTVRHVCHQKTGPESLTGDFVCCGGSPPKEQGRLCLCGLSPPQTKASYPQQTFSPDPNPNPGIRQPVRFILFPIVSAADTPRIKPADYSPARTLIF